MSTRWQLSRGGIFNFWYYDDQEFHFSDGRLILRGANGSGKSVTMQSFIPLVLDGDKRPWRLDPFGSRDRRIEYYLLGDNNSQIQERTGYLYLEFVKPAENKTVTIGIGLRARKGVANLGFWGFVLQDQRRIGESFFLYDEEYRLKYGEKVPLSREKLIEQIGAGGKVVRDQSEYRRLVNQVLFGFADDESYQELLDLLIQLRSPKLSKDFKPTAIYSILTAALPPLKEEELRPLADVLEDMDQISATLDELTIHRTEVERLDDVYTKYNQYLLYEVSEAVSLAQKDRDQQRNVYNELSNTLSGQQVQLSQLQEERDQTELKRKEVSAEHDILSNHEAMEKQRELERDQDSLTTVLEQIDRSEQHINETKKRYERAISTKEEYEQKLQSENEKQQELLLSLEAIARDAEFTDHDLYHRRLEQLQSSDEGIWQSWGRDVDKHFERLKAAHDLAKQEKEAKDQVESTEQEISEVREERDEKEVILREAEKKVEQAIQEQEDRIYQWYRSLQKLPLDDTVWRNILYGLQAYPSTTYDRIKEPAVFVYQQQREKWQRDILQYQHHQNVIQTQIDDKQAELEEWKTQKDPEPKRRKSREVARKARLEQGGTGYPLYACCDFQDHLSEEEKARIESVLEYSGLLDAWIDVEKMGVGSYPWEDGLEEFIIVPQPADFGYTLAHLLKPTPPEDGSITSEQIDQVLRTIRLDGEIDYFAHSAGNPSIHSWMNEKGQFQLGALLGQVEIKTKAEYIGKKTRERTRRERIEALQQQMTILQEEWDQLQTEIEHVSNDIAQITEEIGKFPDETLLLQVDKERKEALFDFEQIQKRLEKIDQEHKRRILVWRELQQKLILATEHWSRLKTEKLLNEAMEVVRGYKADLSELRSSWSMRFTMERFLQKSQEEIAEADEQIRNEQEHIHSLHSRRKGLEHRIQTIKHLSHELGVLNIVQKIEQLKQEIGTLEKKNEKLGQEISDHRVKIGKIEERLIVAQQSLNDKEDHLQKQIVSWRIEWEYGLLPDWKGHEHELASGQLGEKAVIQRCNEITRLYRKEYERKTRENITNTMLSIFQEVKGPLLDYVLELQEEGQRFLVLSMRDRKLPISPSVLKAELIQMEEEQRQLLNEKDRELYEQIIIHSVGKAIRQKIYRAEQWIHEMNELMEDRKTSSGLKLHLEWVPRVSRNEAEIDTEKLVALLKKDPQLLREEEIEQMVEHFRSRIRLAKQEAEERDSLRKWISELLDYRSWFQFILYYKKGDQPRRELTDSRFNVLSGGEKAMAMYIPLFAATYSRYSDSRMDSPKIISLDEAFAGVDEENIRDLFQLLTDMDFDYIMTSQVLWGCFDTVPSLSIYEIIRPGDVDFVTLIRYHWNGSVRTMVDTWSEIEPVLD